MTDHRRAFTLIELLVVIAIIALLVTLLVPALQEAKRMAKVVVCSTQLKGYAMGLVVYAYEDESQKYPPHSNEGWGHNVKIWARSSAALYREVWPDKDEALTLFRDTICGGSFGMLWCPLFYGRPGGLYPSGGGDPNYPLLWLYNDSYCGGYLRFANCIGLDYTESGNAQTDGPPTRPGSSRDAIVCDVVESEPDLYWSLHLEGGVTAAEAIKERRENNVGYGDGHAETHSERAYAHPGWPGYVTWDGAHYVVRGGWILQLY